MGMEYRSGSKVLTSIHKALDLILSSISAEGVVVTY